MNNRNYSLDALRAIMMLLRIVVHAAATYTCTKIFPWPIKDTETSFFYDYLVLSIHSFRMPVFFVLSGFFAALLYDKKGTKATLKNRFNRIVLPFIAAMILIAPLTKIVIMHYVKNISWTEILNSITSLQIFITLNTGHLWFLYYLIMIYTIFHMVKIIKPKFSVYMYNQIKKSIYTDDKNGYKTIVLFSFTSFCFILPQNKGLIDSALHFMPDVFVLLTYLIYFVFGYVLYSRRETLNSIFLGWKKYLLIASIVSLLYFVTFMYSLNTPSFLLTAIASCLCSVLSWLMIFGSFGLFLHKLNHPSKTLSLISKSSYWVYLMHLSLTMLFGGILLSYPLPHYIKFILIASATYVILILAYKLFVERTFIGWFLNGKKKSY